MNAHYTKYLYIILTVFLGFFYACSEQKIDEIVSDDHDVVKGRNEYQMRRLMPPDGVMPSNIRAHEIALRKSLEANSRAVNIAEKYIWKHRGPINVGGRTRALAQDVTNPNVLLAGGVSGGMWRSTNKGQTWERVTAPGQFPGVTAVVQDKRPGKEHMWYYGTGEGIGNSAAEYGSFYVGNGVYSSSDSGKTWNHLEDTKNKFPQNFTTDWDLVYTLKVDNSNLEETELYAAVYGSIMKSTDGGENWDKALDGKTIDARPLYTDVEVSSQGKVYAFISNDALTTTSGIHVSEDGDTWTKITPDFADSYHRMIIELDPNEENLYAYGYTPGSGKELPGRDADHPSTYTSLWKYDIANEQWTDLSQNLPSRQYWLDGMNTQGGFNLSLEISPNNTNHIIVGATNLILSTDGFTTANNNNHIGGYREATLRGEQNYRYDGHHPDLHANIFDAANPTGLISAHDGGVSYSADYTADHVEWTFLTNGYYTTQCHTIAINPHIENDAIAAGLQDNGVVYVGTTDITKDWGFSNLGDGSFAAFASDGSFYGSSQVGNVSKLHIDADGNRLSYYRITPEDAQEQLFINPFILDPNDDNIMYYLGGRTLWRNRNLGQYDAVNDTNTQKLPSGSDHWEKFADTVNNSTGYWLTCLTGVHDERFIYVGTALGNVYKVVNPHSDNPEWVDLSEGLPSNAYATDIAVDPEDPNKFAVVYVNYKVYSLYYTEDGGQTYMEVAGNLEERSSGSGNGPSFRSLTIMTMDDGSKAYVLGTSVGLFATNEMVHDSTVWTPVASEIIGNVVCEMVRSRPSDNLLVVGTHGNGVYSANINQYWNLTGIEEEAIAKGIDAKVYPNPFMDQLTVESPVKGRGILTDISGKKIQDIAITVGYNQLNVNMLPFGTYNLTVFSDQGRYTQQLIKRK